MYILSIVIVGIGIAWLILRLIMRINQTAQQGRGYLWIVIPVFGLFSLGLLYCVIEFIHNKGPDDCGAIFHAMHAVQGKYGRLESPKINISGYDYVRDSEGLLSGTYRFHYQCARQSGVVMCHYDKPTGKFDRDEIDPDK
jgi:hypothetical protein